MMQHVNIYIVTTVASVARKKNAVGCYILEYSPDPKKDPVTKNIFLKLENESQSSADLTMLAKALDRFKNKCNLTIHTEGGQIGIMIMNGWLEKWEQNNWMNSKGKPLADAEKWQQVARLLDGHEYEFKYEKHSYLEWMKRESERMEKENA